MKKIAQFSNENRWLSNFCECKIPFMGINFSSVEAAYVAAKTPPEEFQMRKYIATLSPADAKKFERGELKNESYEFKQDKFWNDETRLSLMHMLVYEKFHPKNNPDLFKKILNTNDIYLEEGNDWNDIFFGVNFKTKKGENNLGKILMKVRDELKNHYEREKAYFIFHKRWRDYIWDIELTPRCYQASHDGF